MVTERLASGAKRDWESRTKAPLFRLMLLWATISVAINNLEGGSLRHFETRQRPDVVVIVTLSLTSH